MRTDFDQCFLVFLYINRFYYSRVRNERIDFWATPSDFLVLDMKILVQRDARSSRSRAFKCMYKARTPAPPDEDLCSTALGDLIATRTPALP